MTLHIQTGKNNPRLRQKSKPVKEITPEIKGLILNMEQTLKTADGLGLAAPQVGQSLRIITIRLPQLSKAQPYTLTLINPKITKSSRQKIIMEEGCLSLPNIYGLVERPAKVTVEGLSSQGEKIEIKANGLLARTLQHEIDHLDGILFIDKLQRGLSLKDSPSRTVP